MTQQHEVPLRNSGASTADWIGQTKGRAIYAYDLAAVAGESSETAGLTKEDFEDALRKASRRITPSQPDEASSGT